MDGAFLLVVGRIIFLVGYHQILSGDIMGRRDKRVDAYIAKAAPFARPILIHIRSLVHQGCPDVEEDIKWGCPHFMYKGMMCSMAAFKSHCAMGFSKHSILPDPDGILERRSATTAMGQLGRISSLEDLPSDRTLVGYVKNAAALNGAGKKPPSRAAARVVKAIRLPAFFKEALKKRPVALKAFDAFSPSHKREYLEWLMEAKTEETRQRRLETAIEWISEGKGRNWKYDKSRG